MVCIISWLSLLLYCISGIQIKLASDITLGIYMDWIALFFVLGQDPQSSDSSDAFECDSSSPWLGGAWEYNADSVSWSPAEENQKPLCSCREWKSMNYPSSIIMYNKLFFSLRKQWIGSVLSAWRKSSFCRRHFLSGHWTWWACLHLLVSSDMHTTACLNYTCTCLNLQIRQRASRDFIHYGYLEKTPPQQTVSKPFI